MNRIQLTFVIPCYNAERFVQPCLDSIFHCGLDEDCYEVLCINDCSTDGTADILRQNSELHGNLRVITHDINKGWGGPRNTGIKEARGLYLWFVDADDMVRKEGLARAVAKADKEGLDVLCFNYERVNGEDEVLSRPKVFDGVSLRDGYTFAKTAFKGGIVNHMGYVWRFIYKTEYLRARQLYFPEKVCWEDTVFMPKSILEAERVSSIPDVLYAYRVNAESVTGVFSRVYPANLIYDFAFHAGPDLFEFSKDVKEEGLSSSFAQTAIKKYINGFAIHLFRTGKKERKRFYEIVGENSKDVKVWISYMSLLNRVLLMPIAGPWITELLSRVYKMTNSKGR